MMGRMNRTKRVARWLGVVSTAGMFLVVVMGATVTNTGSQRGCGQTWPLCHGQFLPQLALQVLIEYSHRIVVGIETVLILALAALALSLYWQRVQVRLLSTLMVVFLFVQAGLGAWAVMQPQSSAALALHFGVSLIAFAAVLLLTVYLFEVDGQEALRNLPLSSGFRAAIWGAAAYSYVVVYLGAFVRHTNTTSACQGWPLCNGRLLPVFDGRVATVFAHRVAAGALVVTLALLVLWIRRFHRDRPDLYAGSLLALGFVALQAVSGAIVVWTSMGLFSALLHAAFVSLMFGSLSYLCLHVTGQRVVAAEGARTYPSGPRPEAAGLIR